MKKRLFAVFVCLCMIVSLLPVTALAVDAPATLYVGETSITGSGYWKTTADGKLEPGNESDYNVHYDGNGTLTLNGATIKGGNDITAVPYGAGIVFDGTEGTVYGDVTVIDKSSPVSYLDENGAAQSCNDYEVVTENDTQWTDGWHVVNSDVTIKNRITVTGTVHLILTDGYTLTASTNGTTTRGQIATMLYRMAGSPAVAQTNPFTDVPYGPDTHWYYDAVLWAQQNGLMQGYGANLFGPNDPVTREQLVMIFYRYEQWRGNDTAASGNLSRFTDVGEVSPWAREAMQWAEGLSAAREMESFTQFSSDLDEATREQLKYGAVLTELLKQPLGRPLSMHEQVITLVAATSRLMMDVETAKVKTFQMDMLAYFDRECPQIGETLEEKKVLDDELKQQIIDVVKKFKETR